MSKKNQLGQIIGLNGAPRSGKSSIASEIQKTFDGVWMNLGVDAFMRMTPPNLLPGIGLRPGGERPDLEHHVEAMFLALYESITAHSRLGINVVTDVGHHDAYSAPRAILQKCARVVSGLPALLVGVRCRDELIIERRLALGEDPAKIDPARIRLWDAEVHKPGIYDLEVDTSFMTPPQCSELIRKRLESGEKPTAFEQLASMSATD